MRPIAATAFLACGLLLVSSPPAFARDGVILLHGLCRSQQSMTKMQSALEQAGYAVVNVDYPSRTAAIEELSATVIPAALADARLAECPRVHFVTHSLGGILVRAYFASHPTDKLGRVVMLGPPNQGSEVVDQLGSYSIFGFINGPAGAQLGTTADSVPNKLGPANFEVGIIAGNRSINWINSTMIDGPDDGKVSVERTKLAGMKDHLVISATHPFLMKDRTAIEQTVHFLREGSFKRFE